MARREWNVAGDGHFGRLEESAGIRTNPRRYAGLQEKCPTAYTVGHRYWWREVVCTKWRDAENRSAESVRPSHL